MTDYAEAAAEALAAPPLAGLTLDMFSEDDLVNLALQRSEILFDQRRSGRIIKAWADGDPAPLRATAQNMGELIARRGAYAIWREFPVLGPVLEDLKPKRIADIGCGYAFFDLFAHQITGAEILLIDLEENESKSFGFTTDPSAYTSLETAKRMMVANGVPAGMIETANPNAVDVTTLAPVDLAVSFLSCGFHYPAETYQAYFETSVAPGGAIILDLRAGRSREARAMFAGMGSIEEIDNGGKWSRVLVRKPA